ncbi:hypothetical protein BaRGS_00027456 [Batillaria attramentaria]|uniref:C2H2-type domain-containing protein n=1 Tax=Batillaria attramentaria TaxID=370345 RepID=A0ABD0K2H9_9CAEN
MEENLVILLAAYILCVLQKCHPFLQIVRGLRLPGLSAFASKLQYQHRQLRPQYLGPPLADLDLTRAALQPVLHPEAGQPDHSAGEGLAAGRGDRDNSYICRNCGKGFAYSHSMIRHRRKCEGTYHLSCQFCGKQFHRRDLYAEHLASNHNAVDSDSQRMHRHALFEVQQAAEDSAIIRDMQEAATGYDETAAPYYYGPYIQANQETEGPSAATTTMQLRHVCKRCGRGYAHVPGLIRHKKQCEGRYDIVCQECGKMFTRRDKYKQHMSKKHPGSWV